MDIRKAFEAAAKRKASTSRVVNPEQCSEPPSKAPASVPADPCTTSTSSGDSVAVPGPSATSPGAAVGASSANLIGGLTEPFHEAPENIPSLQHGNYRLHFQKSWYQDFPWLHYSPQVEGVICFACATASAANALSMETKKEESFISLGFRNWKKALERFRAHQTSSCHQTAAEHARLKASGRPSISAQLSSQKLQQQANSRLHLVKTVRSLAFCIRQGLSFRGHVDNDGNLYQLLLMQAQDDASLKDYLGRTTNFLSHDCINELACDISHAILRMTVKDVRKHPGGFAIVCDGTLDCTMTEQLSICVRHVDKGLTPVEDFLGLHQLSSTTGEAIAACVVDSLLRLDLPILQLRGQTYDGGANMDGQYKGCQAVISRQQPLALHFRCSAHLTNLVAVAVASCDPVIRDALDAVNELGKLYRQSGKFSRLFHEIAADSADSTSIATIRPICPTRWMCRRQAVQSVLAQYEQVLSSLYELGQQQQNDTGFRARGLYDKFARASIFFGCTVALAVIAPLEDLIRIAQGPKVTISGILEVVEIITNAVTSLRCEQRFNAFFDDTNTKAETLGIEALSLPRHRRPPRRYSGPAAAHADGTAQEFYRRAYFRSIDIILVQLRERFDIGASSGLKTYKSLEAALLSGDASAAKETIESYPELHYTQLASQLEIFCRKYGPGTLRDCKETVLQMSSEVRSFFNEVEALVRLLLVCPVSSCEAERSFSGLRRLKTWLRNSMTQKRLNYVAVCNVHKEKLDEVDLLRVAAEFADRSSIRKSAFGRF